MELKKKNKEPKWTEYKDGYRSNMSEKELNEYQERTGRRVYPPSKIKGVRVW